MSRHIFTRRSALKTLGTGVAVGSLSTAASADPGQDDGRDQNGNGRGSDGRDHDDYEVWALDQWSDTLHVLEPDGGGELSEIDAVDLSDDHEAIDGNPEFERNGTPRTTPHMLDFTSDYEYAFVAATRAGQTIVIDAADREVVDALDTGAVSHFAGVQPGDRRVHVDAIGDEKIVEIVIDTDRNGEDEFYVQRELNVNLTRHEGLGFTSNSPVCHDYRPDGKYAYVTFGPAFEDAGLALFDTHAMELVWAYDPEDVRTNCGTLHHPDRPKMYLNGGPFDNGGPIDESPWYVVDSRTHRVVHEADTVAEIGGETSGGVDAHGLWFTPDQEELWMVNRGSNDGVVIDADTDEIVDVVPRVGPAAVEEEPPWDPDEPPENPGDTPDILAAPAGDHDYMYCTLRGMDPQSAAAGGFGENPGVAVLNVETRELETVWTTGADADESDFHAINVRQPGRGRVGGFGP